MGAVLDYGAPPPGGPRVHDRWRLGLRWSVGDGLGGERVGLGGPAVPRPVPGAREEEGEDHGEGQHPAVAQHGQEDPAADQREEDGRQCLAVDPAGQQLAHLVLLFVVIGDEEPREAVEEETDAAGGGEHREGDPEYHGVQIALTSQAGAHSREGLVPAVAPEVLRRPGSVGDARTARGTGGIRGGCGILLPGAP